MEGVIYWLLKAVRVYTFALGATIQYLVGSEKIEVHHEIIYEKLENIIRY